MSYFPEDIPYMSKEELRENGIRIPKDAYVEHEKAQLSQEGTTFDLISRQWLLDCINEGWIKFDTDKDANRFIHLVRDIAPSAQPEPTDEQVEEYCKRRCLHIVTDDFFHTVQPETKEGRWEQVSAQRYFASASYFYRCSVCGENNPRNTNYCPNCGADMRGEKDG